MTFTYDNADPALGQAQKCGRGQTPIVFIASNAAFEIHFCSIYLSCLLQQVARRYEELLLTGDVYALNQFEKNYTVPGTSSQVSLTESDLSSKTGGSCPGSASQKGLYNKTFVFLQQ